MKFNFKNLSFLLVISAVIGLGLSYSKLYLFHIILVLHLVFTITMNRFKIRVANAEMPESKFLIFMFFYYAFTLIWAIKVDYGLRYLFYIFCGNYIVYVMMSLAKNENELRTLFKWLSVFFIIECIVSLLEIFTSFRMPVSPLSSVLELFGRDNSSRLFLVTSTPTGFRWNPNDLAISLVIIVPFFMFAKDIYWRFFGTLSIFFIVLMTSSRGAFIALVLGLIIFPILYSKEKILKYTMWGIFFVILLVSNVAYFKNHDNRQVREISESYDMLEEYVFGVSEENETSIGIRKKLMQNGFIALDETFWLGVGAGGSVAIHELYGGVGTHHVASMHNFWLEIMVEAGIVFALLLIIWYIHVTLKLFKIYLKNKSGFLKYVLKSTTLSMVIFPVAAISSSSTIYLLPMWLLFGLSMVLLNIDQKNKSINQ